MLTFSHTYIPGVFVKGGIVTEGVTRGGGRYPESASSSWCPREKTAVSWKMNVPGKSAASERSWRASQKQASYTVDLGQSKISPFFYFPHNGFEHELTASKE
jgi:hypothetical protein